mgnify:CR=1 FL=1
MYGSWCICGSCIDQLFLPKQFSCIGVAGPDGGFSASGACVFVFDVLSPRCVHRGLDSWSVSIVCVYVCIFLVFEFCNRRYCMQTV